MDQLDQARASTAHALALGRQLDEAAALFTFAVSFSEGRPIVPDQRTSFVTLLGEDSPAGVLAAQWTAIAMVSGARVNAMVTRAELVTAEL